MPKGAKKELTSTGEKRLKTLVGRLRTFRDYKQIRPEELREFEYKVKNSVINASDQGRYVLRLIDWMIEHLKSYWLMTYHQLHHLRQLLVLPHWNQVKNQRAKKELRCQQKWKKILKNNLVYENPFKWPHPLHNYTYPVNLMTEMYQLKQEIRWWLMRPLKSRNYHRVN